MSQGESAASSSPERFWIGAGLNKIRPPSTPPAKQPGEGYEQERDYVDLAQKKAELQLEHRENEARVKSLEDYHKNRSRYTGRIFWLMVAWMACVLLILVASGIKRPVLPEGEDRALTWLDWVVAFGLSEGVLLALIGSTSAIGLFVIVARFLFPGDGGSSRKSRA